MRPSAPPQRPRAAQGPTRQEATLQHLMNLMSSGLSTEMSPVSGRAVKAAHINGTITSLPCRSSQSAKRRHSGSGTSKRWQKYLAEAEIWPKTAAMALCCPAHQAHEANKGRVLLVFLPREPSQEVLSTPWPSCSLVIAPSGTLANPSTRSRVYRTSLTSRKLFWTFGTCRSLTSETTSSVIKL